MGAGVWWGGVGGHGEERLGGGGSWCVRLWRSGGAGALIVAAAVCVCVCGGVGGLQVLTVMFSMLMGAMGLGLATPSLGAIGRAQAVAARSGGGGGGGGLRPTGILFGSPAPLQQRRLACRRARPGQ